MTIEKNDPSRFTIRDGDDALDSLYLSDAENLRIEKLSTRVTLVAVLIPCLLVVVLAVAYLDIKNRVISTQHTGSMGVQNLSKDLESRFSSLSLKQAKLDEQMADNTKTLETATAALQVNLKKATAKLKGINDGKSNRAEVSALSKKTETAIASLQKDMTDLDAAFNKFDEELAAQILLMAEGFKKDQGRLSEVEKIAQRLEKDQGRLSEIEKIAQRLESEKLSKESMNLTLGLERLALQEMVKEKVRNIEKKLDAVDKQIRALRDRLSKQERITPKTPPTSVAPTPPPPSLSSKPPANPSAIVEQNIE